jgi:hypothetical protein
MLIHGLLWKVDECVFDVSCISYDEIASRQMVQSLHLRPHTSLTTTVRSKLNVHIRYAANFDDTSRKF